MKFAGAGSYIALIDASGEIVFESVECNICNSSASKILCQIGEKGLMANVAICTRCGLVFLNPRWTAEGYKNYYKSQYDLDYRPASRSERDKEISETQKAETIVQRIGEVNPGLTVTAILDIGAGMGWGLKAYGAHWGAESLFAIEASENCLQNLEQLRIQVISEEVFLNWENQYQGKFSLIIMRHVLEHLLDPQEALAKVWLALADQGIAYISVPDMMRPRGSMTRYFFRIPHTYYFSEWTLKYLLEKAGLQILSMGSVDSELFCIVRKDYQGKMIDNYCTKVYFRQKRVIKRRLWFDNNIREPLRTLKRLLGKGI